MLFWIILLLMTVVAVMSVLRPLARAPRARADAAVRSRGVYIDQLSELERDRSEGRIAAEEAEAARAEIARRLLALDHDRGPAILGDGRPLHRRLASLVALIGIPLLSLGFYFSLGAPGLPGQPLAARLSAPAANSDLAVLMRRVEEHLARSPEDGKGWDVIAPVYLRLGRAEDAARAYGNAIRILGSDATRDTGLGEAIVASQGGVVTAEAKEAFSRANKADPAAVSPRFFLALARGQEGDTQGAAADMNALLDSAPADAPWRHAVETEIARLQTPAAPGPTQQDVAAAAEMSEGDRTAMIEGMVGRLAERLKQQPDDVESWIRLVRAYDVLGKPAEASAAAQSARGALTGDEDRKRIDALVAELKLPASEVGTP